MWGDAVIRLFQWLTDEESRSLADEDLERVNNELADIQIYLVRMADVLGIDMGEAVQRKLEKNAERYPVGLSRGNATKYSRRAP